TTPIPHHRLIGSHSAILVRYEDSAARSSAISRPGSVREKLGSAFFSAARDALLRVLPAKLLLGQLDLLHFFPLHDRPRQCLLRPPFGLLGLEIEKFPGFLVLPSGFQH